MEKRCFAQSTWIGSEDITFKKKKEEEEEEEEEKSLLGWKPEEVA